MPNVKQKSEENLKAAQELINVGCYSASIHCSYYSSFQFMKYILNFLYKIDYEKQNQHGKTDSHEYIFKEIFNKAINPTLSRGIRMEFNFLRAERLRADYQIDIFDDLESIEAIDSSKRLQAKLKQQFGAL